MDCLKLVKDGSGTQVCREYTYKHKGCARSSCPGWHPARGTRDAKKVLDAVKKAMPAFPFDAI
jgi:hypothetical protein